MTVKERLEALRILMKDKESMHIWFRRMISTVRNMWVIILNAENILQVLRVRQEQRLS